MTTSKSVTVTFTNIPTQLHEEILAGSSKSAAVVELLNELVRLRQGEVEEGEQVRALRIELAQVQGSLQGMRVVADARKRDIDGLQKSLHSKKEDMTMKIKMFRAQDKRAGEAMSHALALIHHLNPRRPNDAQSNL
jgi:hypothetical protein